MKGRGWRRERRNGEKEGVGNELHAEICARARRAIAKFPKRTWSFRRSSGTAIDSSSTALAGHGLPKTAAATKNFVNLWIWMESYDLVGGAARDLEKDVAILSKEPGMTITSLVERAEAWDTARA